MPSRRGVSYPSAATRVNSSPYTPSPPITGLTFPSNGVTGSDIRLVWSGANLLPRASHTAIWKANYVQQTGYYALTWHSHNTGTWGASTYEFGAHPFPCDGTVSSAGGANGPTGPTGTVHYYEIAGLGAFDYIASPGPGSTTIVTKGVWVTQARTCEVVGGNVRHTFWPDVSAPSVYIQIDVASPLASGGASPAFYFGASDWTGDGSVNNENPSCTLRGLALFNAALTITDIATEAASDSNSAQTSAGQAAVWYINKNPTPSDVTDKSGAGHSPSWANANRPTLYTG